jgi:DNA-binding response OmpR family regulator
MASRIDLVLTALKMLEMDGVQAILRIRMTRKEAKIVCMVESPDDRPPDGLAVLKKPFSPAELTACVDHALRLRAYAA